MKLEDYFEDIIALSSTMT